MSIEKYLNKITQSDCYELIKELPDKSIDLIVTDPPYLIENTKAGGVSDLAKSIQNMNNELETHEEMNKDLMNLLEKYND